MALAQYTDRALRFAACVPRHLQSKFNVFMKDNLGLAMPPCDQAGIFDLHEHFTFRGLGDLRASATDLEDALVLDVNRPAASFWPRNRTQWARNHRNCHAHEPCRSEVAGRLEHALFGPRRSTSRVLAVVMMHLRIADRILVRPWLSAGINGDGRMMNHREWESCLRDLRPLRGWQVPPCDVGLHVRTLAVDDARCNVFSVEDSSNPCPSNLAGRLRDSKKGKLPWPASVDGCPGTHRFVTADTPRVYGTTRLLGWTDLNETAEHFMLPRPRSLRKTVVSSAERGTQGGGRSEQTLAAFWALTRCKTAIVAPFDSSFSNTAAKVHCTPRTACKQAIHANTHARTHLDHARTHARMRYACARAHIYAACLCLSIYMCI